MKLFSAPWCTYCTPVKDFIKDNNLPIEVINVDQDPSLVAKHGIRGIPALVLDDGTVVSESRVILNLLMELP